VFENELDVPKNLFQLDHDSIRSRIWKESKKKLMQNVLGEKLFHELTFWSWMFYYELRIVGDVIAP